MIIYRTRAQAIIHEFAENTFDKRKKVLIPCNVCSSIVLSYLNLGIPIEMVDIDAQTLSMDLDEVERKIKNHPNDFQGIHYVYNYGFYSEKICDRLVDIKHKNNIKIIEDCCLCEPDISFDESKKIKSDLKVYSTGHCKYVDIDYGGYAYSNEGIELKKEQYSIEKDEDLVDFIARDRHADTDWIKVSKYRWLEIASISDLESYKVSVIEKYNEIKKHKEILNHIYYSGLNEKMVCGRELNSWRFNIIVNNNAEVLKKLSDNALFASNHYRPWGGGIIGMQRFEKATSLWDSIINLFNDSYYTDEQAEKTVEIIRKYAKY